MGKHIIMLIVLLKPSNVTFLKANTQRLKKNLRKLRLEICFSFVPFISLISKLFLLVLVGLVGLDNVLGYLS